MSKVTNKGKITYIQQEDEYDYLKAFIDTTPKGRCTGILLIGPPGTGKTLLATDLALNFKASCYVIDGSPDLDRRDLEGCWEIKEKGTELVYGQLVRAIQDANKDGIAFVLINEINAIRESEQISFNSLLSEEAIDLVSKAGERWELNPDSKLVIIGTMNPGVTGVVKLQDAFDDRFRTNLEIGYPKKSKEIEIVKNMAKCSKEIASVVVDAGRQLRKANIQDMSIPKPFSTRKMVNFCETVSRMPPKFIRRNIETMIINKIAEDATSKKSVATILHGKLFESKLKNAVLSFQGKKEAAGTTAAMTEDPEEATDRYIVNKMKKEIASYLATHEKKEFVVLKTGYLRWQPLQQLWDDCRKITQAYFKLTERTNLPKQYQKETSSDHMYGGDLTLRYIKWLYRHRPKELLAFMKKKRPVIPNKI